MLGIIKSPGRNWLENNAEVQAVSTIIAFINWENGLSLSSVLAFFVLPIAWLFFFPTKWGSKCFNGMCLMSSEMGLTKSQNKSVQTVSVCIRLYAPCQSRKLRSEKR